MIQRILSIGMITLIFMLIVLYPMVIIFAFVEHKLTLPMCNLIIFLTVILMIVLAARVIYEKMNRGYSSKGHLSCWYDKTLNLIGIDWIHKILVKAIPDKLRDKGEIVIVNVSANRGVYDYNLFETLSNNQKHVDMRLMDREVIHEHVTAVNNYYGKLEYYESLDALDVINNFIKYNIPPADVLLDIKGCLWYAAKRNGGLDILRILQSYYEVLKPGGILVVDASDINRFKATLNREFGLITNRYSGYAEVSTHQRLKKHLDSNSEISVWIQENFELEFIEIENQKPQIKMMIFKKRCSN